MLFRFPKEPNRRAIWISFVNRLNWQPSADSTLCELHFDKDQWERQRTDGSRKLKCSAIPSLQCPTENSTLTPYIHWKYEHNYCHSFNSPAENITLEVSKTSETKETPEITKALKIMKIPETTETSKTIETPKTMEIQSSDTQISDSTKAESIDSLKQQLLWMKKKRVALQLKYDSLQKVASQTFKSYYSIKKRYNAVASKLKRLQDYRKQKFGIQLHEDQQIVLCSKMAKGRKWSIETINDGLTYKTKWGTQDYANFVKRFPIFPSVRTLQRASEQIKFKSGILHEGLDVIQCRISHMAPHEI